MKTYHIYLEDNKWLFKNLNEDQLAEKVKEKFEMMQKKFNNNFEGICKSSELSIINGSNP